MFVKRLKNENNFVLLILFKKNFLPSKISNILHWQLSQRHFLLDPQYLGVYVCDSRIDFSPSQLRISRVGLRHTHHPAKGRENIYVNIIFKFNYKHILIFYKQKKNKKFYIYYIL